jgi:hypothetical protein
MPRLGQRMRVAGLRGLAVRRLHDLGGVRGGSGDPPRVVSRPV